MQYSSVTRNMLSIVVNMFVNYNFVYQDVVIEVYQGGMLGSRSQHSVMDVH